LQRNTKKEPRFTTQFSIQILKIILPEKFLPRGNLSRHAKQKFVKKNKFLQHYKQK